MLSVSDGVIYELEGKPTKRKRSWEKERLERKKERGRYEEEEVNRTEAWVPGKRNSQTITICPAIYSPDLFSHDVLMLVSRYRHPFAYRYAYIISFLCSA